MNSGSGLSTRFMELSQRLDSCLKQLDRLPAELRNLLE